MQTPFSLLFSSVAGPSLLGNAAMQAPLKDVQFLFISMGLMQQPFPANGFITIFIPSPFFFMFLEQLVYPKASPWLASQVPV